MNPRTTLSNRRPIQTRTSQIIRSRLANRTRASTQLRIGLALLAAVCVYFVLSLVAWTGQFPNGTSPGARFQPHDVTPQAPTTPRGQGTDPTAQGQWADPTPQGQWADPTAQGQWADPTAQGQWTDPANRIPPKDSSSRASTLSTTRNDIERPVATDPPHPSLRSSSNNAPMQIVESALEQLVPDTVTNVLEVGADQILDVIAGGPPDTIIDPDQAALNPRDFVEPGNLDDHQTVGDVHFNAALPKYYPQKDDEFRLTKAFQILNLALEEITPPPQEPQGVRVSSRHQKNANLVRVSNLARETERKETTLRRKQRETGARLKVAMVGAKWVINRDGGSWKATYQDAGFEVFTPKKSIRGGSDSSGRTPRKDDADVILCLSTDVKVCMRTNDFFRTETAGVQRVSHLLFLREVLWSKDKFCKTIKRGTANSGTLMNEFTFPCWVLPADNSAFSAVASLPRTASKQWIMKPSNAGGGEGIFVVDGQAGVEKALKNLDPRKRWVVQPYLPNPHLIFNRKWDLRTYVLVTSVYPVRVYMYSDGLARFASEDYNATATSGGHKEQFLTNTSVNKKKNGNMSELTWPFNKLEQHMHQDTKDPNAYLRIRRNMDSSLAMLMLCAEKQFLELYQREFRKPFFCDTCYHLLGVDFIVDTHGNTRVIEVNGEPSMALTKSGKEQYDRTKLAMQRNVVDIVHLASNQSMGAIADDVASSLELLREFSRHDMFGDAVATGIDWETFSFLGKRDMKYLVHMHREAMHMGQFRRIYPNPWSLVGTKRERKRWEVALSRVDMKESRRRFHDLLSHFELLRLWKASKPHFERQMHDLQRSPRELARLMLLGAGTDALDA